MSLKELAASLGTDINICSQKIKVFFLQHSNILPKLLRLRSILLKNC